MKLRVDVKGLKPMQKKMLKRIKTEDIRPVIKRNVAEMEARAITLAPVSTEKTKPGGPHGELRKSIISKTSDTEGTVVATKDYAEYVELGTRFMKPQPYMRPALREQEPVFIRDMKKLIARNFK